jgi:hypothetical protein
VQQLGRGQWITKSPPGECNICGVYSELDSASRGSKAADTALDVLGGAARPATVETTHFLETIGTITPELPVGVADRVAVDRFPRSHQRNVRVSPRTASRGQLGRNSQRPCPHGDIRSVLGRIDGHMGAIPSAGETATRVAQIPAGHGARVLAALAATNLQPPAVITPGQLTLFVRTNDRSYPALISATLCTLGTCVGLPPTGQCDGQRRLGYHWVPSLSPARLGWRLPDLAPVYEVIAAAASRSECPVRTPEPTAAR